MNDKERRLTVRSFAAAAFLARTYEPLGVRMSGSLVVFEFPQEAAAALADYTRLNAMLNGLAATVRDVPTTIVKEPARDLSQPR